MTKIIKANTKHINCSNFCISKDLIILWENKVDNRLLLRSRYVSLVLLINKREDEKNTLINITKLIFVFIYRCNKIRNKLRKILRRYWTASLLIGPFTSKLFKMSIFICQINFNLFFNILMSRFYLFKIISWDIVKPA